MTRLEIVVQLMAAYIITKPSRSTTDNIEFAGIIADAIIEDDKKNKDAKWSKHS